MKSGQIIATVIFFAGLSFLVGFGIGFKVFDEHIDRIFLKYEWLQQDNASLKAGNEILWHWLQEKQQGYAELQIKCDED